MSQYILTDRGTVLTIQTVRSLTPAEMNSPVESKKRDIFDKIIADKYGDSRYPPKNWHTRNKKKIDPDIDDSEVLDDDDDPIPHNISVASMEVWDEDDDDGINDDRSGYKLDEDNVIDTDDIPDLDQYLTAAVLLPQDGEYLKAAKVVQRVTDGNGDVIGKYNSNPILDTRVYKVMFPDGSIQQYSENVIAENIYAQVDEEEHRYQLLEGILLHRRNEKTLSKENAFDKRGKRRLTTKGCDLCVQ